jgi:hypothetical protein
MINYHLILSMLYADKQWSMSGDDYSGLDWFDSAPKPTKEQLDAQQDTAVTTAITNQQADKDAKASALAKLTALGLTEDEVKALLGIK